MELGNSNIQEGIIDNKYRKSLILKLKNREQVLIKDNILCLKKSKREKSVIAKVSYKFVKRVMDIIISAVALIIVSPVFLLIGVLIRIDSKGPIIFKHKRIGKNGNEIGLYKFRSMKQNAEDLIKKFTPEQMKEYKTSYKVTNDPRITKIGRIIRKTSLDELPQLLNILKGDISIIGPRPVIKEELEKYREHKDLFLSVTPGLTGYWAANGRSDTTYEQRIQMELYYVKNATIILDIKIIIKTIISVLKKEGAI